MLNHINVYCERLDASFWAEPANAVSNLAFVVAALVCVVSWRRRGGRDLPALALILLTLAFAVASFLFHTLATPASAVVDAALIGTIILLLLYVGLRRHMLLSAFPALAGLGVFVAIVAAVAAYGQSLMGWSAVFVPAVAAILLMAVVAISRDPEAAGSLFSAAAILALSLAFRSLDLPLCESFPIGTHFMWHVLNAMTVTILIRAMIHSAPTMKARRMKHFVETLGERPRNRT